MWRYKEKLEGGYQVVRLKRLRRRIFLVEGLVLLAILVLIVTAKGASMNPFYVPLDIAFIYGMAVLWAFSVQNHFFRNLEIRNVRRGSRKHLMTLNSIRRAVAIAAVCAVLVVIFTLPQTTAYVSEQLSSSDSVDLGPGQGDARTFTNQDRLGLVKTTSLVLSAPSGRVIAAWGTPEDFDGGTASNLTLGRVPSTIRVGQEGFRTIVLQLNNTGVGAARALVESRVELAPGMLLSIPIVAMLFIITSIAWVAYLNPLRVQFAATSIYSSEYEAKVEAGDRTWEEVSAAQASPPAERVRKRRVRPGVAGQGPTAASPPTVDRLGELPPPPEDDKDSLTRMGWELMEKGNWKSALKCFDGALDQDRNHPGALEGRANVLIRVKRKDDAIATLERLVDVQEDNLSGLLMLADLSEGRGHYTRAVECYEAALRLHPDRDEWWVRKGDVLLKLGRDADAYDAYRNALKVNPDLEEAKEKLSMVEVDMDAVLEEAMAKASEGNYPGAVEQYDRILRQDPWHIMALLGKGVAYQKLDKHMAAAETLQKVLDLDPGNEAALMRLASLSEDQGRLSDALGFYDRVLEVRPGDRKALLSKGDTLSEMGRLEEALASYEKAMEEHPGSPEARERLKETVGRIERGKKAIVSQLISLPGIGPTKARAIVDAGYTSVDAIRRAKASELAKVKGVSRRLAKVIAESFGG